MMDVLNIYLFFIFCLIVEMVRVLCTDKIF